jgi:DNA-binding XRE family transcriptional regulator
MNIYDLAERLQTTKAGFARIAGVSRATLNSWVADPNKSYAAVPRDQTLLDMAECLDKHSEEARAVAGELRSSVVPEPVPVPVVPKRRKKPARKV